MGFLEVIKELNLDLSVCHTPIDILFFNEYVMEGRSFYNVGYGDLFPAEVIELFLENKMNLDEILEMTVDEIFARKIIANYEFHKDRASLPHWDEFAPLLRERLEYLKSRKDFAMNKANYIVMNAILNSKCTSLPLWEGSVDKYYLLTLLSIIEWSPYFTSVGGWGREDTTLSIAIDNVFVSSDIEILLPVEETEKLIYELDEIGALSYHKAKEWIEDSKQHYEKKDKEIEQKFKTFWLK
ncbi:hypothetical protein CN630_17770 [Bacillus wiedmannii]|uniref:hypothetical protein n=1 Tax=Bacillus wiedmannii TaxID=1890302 RepID=UPI000BF38DAD|nr:hypothetical protein [Bacillus wiedmannii]PEN45644.1 hypothetical protein CN630_17770 [Bacillus wiedmannii]